MTNNNYTEDDVTDAAKALHRGDPVLFRGVLLDNYTIALVKEFERKLGAKIDLIQGARGEQVGDE